MAWFRLDDQGAFHAKVLAAGNEAYGAWCRAGQWSSGHGTEGLIPRATAFSIAQPRVWRRLIEAKGTSQHGLAEAVGEDFRIHDFLDWNPTVEEVEAKRAARAEAGRRGGMRSGEARRKQPSEPPDSKREANDEAIASANAKQNRTPIPIPIPIPIPEEPDLPIQPDTFTAPQGAVPAESPTGVKLKRGTRLPAGWMPSDETQAWARKQGLQEPCGSVLDEFRDFWAGMPGSRGVKLDWEATFRNRVRQACSRGLGQRSEPQTGARLRQPHDSEWMKTRTGTDDL